MKKLIYSMLALAMTAMTFVSCEDVPEPYLLPTDNGNKGDSTVVVEPAGSGTAADPFNVAGANQYIKNGGSEDAEVYVKGIVVSVKAGSYDSNYGSLKYYISDDGTSTNQFYVFNGYAGPNRTKFSGEDALKPGDEVVICGKLVNYSGTYEFTTGNYIYSLNGKTGGNDTPSTDNSKDNPYSVAEAVQLINDGKAPTTEVYVKGKISEVTKFNETYKSITYYISDNGTSKDLQVFSGKGLDGADFNALTDLSVGQEVTILGVIKSFNGTPEIDKNNKIVAFGGGSSTGDILNETFESSIGSFSIVDVNLNGLSYVWRHDASYKQMKASAFANGANTPAESWLVSSALDLSKATNPTLTFDQALNFLKGSKRENHVNVMVSTNYTGDVSKATWTALEVSPWPEGTSWTFGSSSASLKAYAGKKGVHIAFKYVSTADAAPIWEIKNVVIK